MTKKQLAEKVAMRTGLEQGKAYKAVNETLEVIADSLIQGKEVYLRGFGTFKTVKRRAKKGRLISANQEMNIPARREPKVVFSKNLKVKIDDWRKRAGM